MNLLREAVWDLAALGVRTQVLHAHEQSSVADLRASLERMDAPYQVVRIPTSANYLLYEVQDKGFLFAEVQMSVHHAPQLPVVPELYARLLQNIEVTPATTDDIATIEMVIQTEIFTTDRISLDRRFGTEVAAKRYLAWFRQELATGAICNVLVNKDAPFAFSLAKKEGPHLRGILSGLLPGIPSLGLGWSIPYFEILVAIREGAESGFCFSFSSNNLSVLRTVCELGFLVKSQEYIFVNSETPRF